MRLAEVVDRLGGAVTVEWRSFLLRPGPEDRSMEAFTGYTRNWARPAELEPGARFVVPWSGKHAPPSHSFPAALAGKVASSFGPGPGSAYATRLFEGYFAEHRTISDRDVLGVMAEETGLDRGAFDARWREREDELGREVWRDHVTAVQSGITGVPAVVVDRRWLVPGAVEVDQYVAVVERAASGADAPDG